MPSPSPRTKKDRVLKLFQDSKRVGDCIIPPNRPGPRGYVYINYQYTYYRAHRLVWEVINGEISEDDLILHRCDNRACINPKHLYLGDAMENTTDMMEKRRGANQYQRGYSWNISGDNRGHRTR